LWSSLVAVEIALALTVLVCANLLVKSQVRQLSADTGFDPRDILTTYATPDFSGQSVWDFYSRVTEQLSATPGFTAVGLAQWLDTGENPHWWAAYVEELGGVRDVRYQRCDPGYFAAMGIPLVSGRNFDSRDSYAAPHVVMVNQSFAERYWPGEEPVGKRLGRGSASPAQQDWHEVIAVVADAHNAGYGRPAEPQVFLPYNQSRLDFIHVVARTNLDTPTAMRVMREVVHSVDPQVPLSQFLTMKQAIRQANWQIPFAAWSFGLLSIIALALAATGVYGLVAFTVTQRSRDLAIRVAVGADSRRLQRMVVRENLMLAGGGVLAGIVLAAAGMRLAVSLLYTVGPRDPVAYAVSVAVMAAAVLLASYLPTRRIVRLDPIAVLGQE
jgi:putative ABC transport system permease protein